MAEPEGAQAIALHDPKIVAPLKPPSPLQRTCLNAALHDPKIVAPLKLMEKLETLPPRIPLHDPKIVAPLKHQHGFIQRVIQAYSPRSQNRGPVEAHRRRESTVGCGWTLHDPKIVAPLKLGIVLVSQATELGALHDPKIVAPLKRRCRNAEA